ncbi:phosphoglycerate dehydrogenase [candidate division WOR-1 bacterium RIFOXYB2_FULL_48_7]|uniref:D-3-phosphoglycerate dehydrogenase n=1 Tax=candidate division WOR-1 bacterium RIFOXYB2_FULL_48_7 TaxID=1802583 RepID=A0A1F4TS57_UNCSA|nr:MAG: phosphoglycerate dehydrogenase [candidate division WOR-1 bacterium RIFOXYB2_FULL_48_7]
MKVLAMDKVAEEGLKIIKEAGIEVDSKAGLPEEEIIKIIPDYDALIVRSETRATPKIIEAGKNLKIIARAGVGVDNIDLPTATKNGVIVVNSPEGNTVAAAEHTWAMLLSMTRSIPQAHGKLKTGVWDKKSFKGVEVLNKTLGVIGLGKIGRRVVAYALGMGMRVIGSDPFVTAEYAKSLGIELKSIEDVIKEADFITFHIPKTKETAGMINKETIAKMKKGVRLVNVARGGIINEADLAEALKNKHVAAAALDVFEKEPCENSPLFQLDNVVVTPHLGASTVEAQVNVAIDVAEQIVEVLKGGAARSAVNIPSMKPELITPVRPFMSIAEKLGSLAAQLVKGAVTRVEVEYAGEVADNNVSPLTTIVMKGLLTPMLDVKVNFVNAPFVAKERGIEIVESKNKESKDFASLITLRIKTEKETREIGGTIFSGVGDRLVMIDGYRVDAVPQGYMLILQNIDKPGMIGKVGTFLGQHNINIAAMDVGRIRSGEKAVMVLNIDNQISEKLLQEMTKLEGIAGATLVKI